MFSLYLHIHYEILRYSMIDINKIPSPCYVMEEKLLRNNLSLIKSVKERAGVNIILAFKAFALWKAFPIVREYIPFSTASSKFEARLAFEELGSPAHTYSPAYTEPVDLEVQQSRHVQLALSVPSFLSDGAGGW